VLRKLGKTRDGDYDDELMSQVTVARCFLLDSAKASQAQFWSLLRRGHVPDRDGVTAIEFKDRRIGMQLIASGSDWGEGALLCFSGKKSAKFPEDDELIGFYYNPTSVEIVPVDVDSGEPGERLFVDDSVAVDPGAVSKYEPSDEDEEDSGYLDLEALDDLNELANDLLQEPVDFLTKI